MTSSLRQQVYDKFNGKCAYTGLPLEDDWQVDHMHSKRMYKTILIHEAHYKNIETSEIISVDEFFKKIDNCDRQSRFGIISKWKHFPLKTKPHTSVNNIENLMPSLRIVNHYKRELDLEGFRKYMLNFHIRLSKLPKRTAVFETEKRKIYMQKVADAFGITVDNKFDGIFYFEKI